MRWLDAELRNKGASNDIWFAVATPAGSTSRLAFQAFRRRCAQAVIKNIVAYLKVEPDESERDLLRQACK